MIERMPSKAEVAALDDEYLRRGLTEVAEDFRCSYCGAHVGYSTKYIYTDAEGNGAMHAACVLGTRRGRARRK